MKKIVYLKFILQKQKKNFEYNIFSDSLFFLKLLSKILNISNVYTNKINLFRSFCKKKKINLIKIDSKNITSTKRQIFFIFGISKIFNKEEIKKFGRKLINIHFGDLPNYRGRHPLTWAFINNEKKIGCSIHLINTKIDRGYLLNKFFVKRNLNDTIVDIENKIYKKLPVNILIALINLHKNKKKKISRGNYYPPIYNGIKIDKTTQYSRSSIIRFINAQFKFNGLQIGNKNYKYYSLKNKKKYSLFYCKYNKKIFLKN